MIYGADRIVQMPVMQLYDTGLMLQAVENARYIYDKAEKRMDDFYKEYDNFVTPIQKDQDWYNENVIGRFRRGIDELYANGEDPLRTATGRAKLAQLARSIDVGVVNKLRTSAQNATEFLKERSKLEAAGLYNPLFAKYDGPDINSYSTLESGAWDKMSPTRIVDMATFGNPYFEGMKPNVHKSSKNGVSYSIEKIDENDLRNIADAHYNELVSTPQGQLMYRYYVDMAGGDRDVARQMFNNAIVDGQRRRIYQKDDFDDQWDKHQQIAQGWARINQSAQQLQLEKDKWNFEKSLYGNQNTDIPTAGASDQVAIDQDKQRNKVKAKYLKQIRDNEKNSYNALSENKTTSREGRLIKTRRTGERVVADNYKRAWQTIQNSNASKEEKDKARDFVSKWDKNGSDKFKKWANDYKLSVDKTAVNTYLSSISSPDYYGKEQPELNLYNKAHQAFERQNILTNSVDTGIQKDVNTSLALVDDGNGNLIGNVTKDTDFAPIIEAAVTGNRRYKHNSDINKINRLIKGKSYKITSQNITGRGYGSGSIGDTRYNMVRLLATFDDPDVIQTLTNNYTSEGLASIGITKNSDGSYNIPIISKYSKGSQTWADVNTETDKRVGGLSEATKHRATRQARSLISNI